MSQAEDLLNSLSDDGSTSTYSTDPSTEEHIVIGQDRFITVPDSLKRIAVQYDHNIETVTFDCPRYWDGIDMSVMNIYINYLRADNRPGIYKATNIIVDETDASVMHFDWVISRNVSEVKGSIAFIVCIKEMDDEGYEEAHWNSEICRDMYVSEGLEHDDVIALQYPDVITQILEQLAGMGGSIDGTTSFVVDTALSETSTNPVQNKVVTAAIRDVETSVGNVNSLLETI